MKSFLEAVVQIIPLFLKLFTLYRESKQKGWIDDGNEIAKQIGAAHTDDERKALARRLFTHLK